MMRKILLVAMMAIATLLNGCPKGKSVIPTFVDASSIPDVSYRITEYRGPTAASYAVLFDIPNDTTELFMEHAPFVDKVGSDSSRGYVDEFHSRIKGGRTLRISDQGGNVRGYLLVSNLLNYRIQLVGERIKVSINDPYYDQFQSAP